MKYSNENFRRVSVALYQFTGLSYYLLPFAEINAENWHAWNKMQEFHKRLKLVRELIAKGETYKYFLVGFGGKIWAENHHFGV